MLRVWRAGRSLHRQGDADSRAGIRLSGADVIIGGMPRKPLDNNAGNLANHANIKGFAFEYMTGGRGLVLGDPGPWTCSGMSGGEVYFRIDHKMGLTLAALEQRLTPRQQCTPDATRRQR